MTLSFSCLHDTGTWRSDCISGLMRETHQKSTKTPLLEIQIPQLRKCVANAMKDKGHMVYLTCQRTGCDTIWEPEDFMFYLKLLSGSLLWLFKTVISFLIEWGEILAAILWCHFLSFLLMESIPNMSLMIVNILLGRSWLCVFIYKTVFISTVIFHMSSLEIMKSMWFL